MAEIKFTLSKEEAEFVLNALAQLPYAQSAGLINKLQQQAQESLAASDAAPVSAAESEEKPKK
jgi:hypothetical protein